MTAQLVATADIRKKLADDTATITCPRCQTEVKLHGIHWVSEVCPKCLQSFRWGYGADYNLYTDCGFWHGEGERKIRAKIAADGGRYLPTF